MSTLTGTPGTDIIIGGPGDDIISGLGGDDQLTGNEGNDTIDGGPGNDIITGGPGNDILTGGTGVDSFRDTMAGLNGDHITDFLPGDRIQITDLNIQNANIAINDATNTITFNGNSITIDNLGPGRLIVRGIEGGGVEIRLEHDANNDINGDSRSDILWRNDNGALTDWTGTANGGFSTNGGNLLTVVDTQWQIAGTGDFNGDGRIDVLWHRADGALTDWLGTANGGLTPNGGNELEVVDPQWQIAGVGDFNGDGRDDILWHRADGALTDWLGNANGSFTPNASNLLEVVDPQWQVAGVGDFNGDGIEDVLWRRADGALTDWLGTPTGGLVPNGGNLLTVVDSAWKVAGIGDFNGDGIEDVLWRRTDGALTDWLGTPNGGLSPNSSNLLTVVSTDWHVAAVGDYNGDGIDDILWRNDDGRLTDWLGTNNGSFVDNSANASTMVDIHWHVQPVHNLVI